jgi:hypothetical protein
MVGERLPEANQPSYRAGMYYLNSGPWLASLAAELREPGSEWAKVLRHAWSHEIGSPRVPSPHMFGDPGPTLGKLFKAPVHG